jgi:hypothetical protein
MVKEEKVEYKGKQLRIKYVTNHYYLPIILSDDERIDYIKHIIKTPSEVKFVNDLEDYLERSDNKFKDFDWWFFSKLDESLDEIYIPYYNPNINNVSQFYPDFIFWLNKGIDYFIVFVDPKGTEYVSAYRKIDGYKTLFEEKNETKIIGHIIDNNVYKVRIKLLFRTDDTSKATKEYKQYWFGNVGEMFDKIYN